MTQRRKKIRVGVYFARPEAVAAKTAGLKFIYVNSVKGGWGSAYITALSIVSLGRGFASY
jgi:hypothetical protein